MRKLLTIVAMLVVVPATAYAGGGGGTSRCAGFATGTTVSMLDSCFEGTAHFAPAEATLTISNDGEFPHTFTAVDGSFDSGILQTGETFELTVDEPGVIQFFCTLHGTAEGQGMAGVLLIGEVEPAPLTAPVNVAAIKQAVAEENRVIVEDIAGQVSELGRGDGDVVAAIDRQNQAIADLADSQTQLTAALALQQEPEDAAAAATPTIVTVPGESTANDPWIPLATGLAIGLAVAAIYRADRSRRRQRTRVSSGDALRATAD